MKIGDRIKLYLERNNMLQRELAEKVNIDRVVMNKILNNNRPIRTDELEAIAKVFHVTPNDLYGYEDNITFTSPIPDLDVSGIKKLKETNRIPVIGSVKCGSGGLAYEYIDEYITIDDTYSPDEMRAFRATGRSMEGDGRNGIYDGDICLVHLQDKVPNNSIAVVVIEDGDESEGTLKRFHKEPDGTIILQATNPSYPPRVFSGKDANRVRVVGRVVEIRRKRLL